MLPDTWTDLDCTEAIHGVREVLPCLYTIQTEVGYDQAACWASKHAGGQWIAKAGGITWRNGAHTSSFVLPVHLPELLAAREVCQRLGVEAGVSIGSCARRLLAWIGPPEYPYW